MSRLLQILRVLNELVWLALGLIALRVAVHILPLYMHWLK